MEQEKIGSIINERYRLDAKLGRGGMGTVFKGSDLHLDRKVAIKVLSQDNFNLKDRGRFYHEAKVIAKLKHPNIVEVYDVGESETAPFFVMELIEGIPLKSAKTSDLDEILDIFEQICLSLEFAHEHGIVHRDLKPENVLIDKNGIVKLVDFGIARSEVSNLTTTGEIIGTVNYLAPEIAKGEQIDGRADLYSLGVMLFEITTSRLPFIAENPATIITKHLFEKPPSPSTYNPKLPPGLIYLINRLLSKSPEDRPESALEVRTLLGTLHSEEIAYLERQDFPSPEEMEIPASLIKEIEAEDLPREVFVGRERELKRLNAYFEEAAKGKGQVVFISGGPGRGKTALVRAFTQQEHFDQNDVLIAWGTCNAFSGIGDPYLPFREICTLLSGELKERHRTESITQRQALQLWHAFPTMLEALLSIGNDLVNTLVPGDTLLSQAAIAFPERIDLLGKLAALVERKQDPSVGIEQSMLFEQCANVLEMISQNQLLILVIDDLQWADSASISLLFYLGRRLTGTRILILGMYRPHEVLQGRGKDEHPLRGVIAELKRVYGDLEVNLGESDQKEDREFIDAFLDTEPNILDDEFRNKLYTQTGGHPLFTIELLRAIQESGDLEKDDNGRWVPGRSLNWDQLPARVEGVIEERLRRLNEESQEILSIASVEGEEFTAQVICQVQEIKERKLLRQLSDVLDNRHRLVKEVGEQRINGAVLSLFRFSHNLYQRYIYNNLGTGERRLLHGEIGQAIEDLYQEQESRIEPLAYHFLQAENWDKAWIYQVEAGKNAHYRFASREAIAFFRSALDLADQLTTLEVIEKAEVHSLIADVLSSVNEYEQAMAELALAISLLSTDQESPDTRLVMARIYHMMGQVLRNEGKYPEAMEVIQNGIDNLAGDQPKERGALQIAMASALTRQGELESAQKWCEEGMQNVVSGEDLAELAHAYSLLGTIRRDLGDTDASLTYRQKSLEISEDIASIPLQMEAHNNLAVAYYDQGQLDKAVYHYNQSRDLSKRMGNLNTTARAEINLGEVELIRGDWEEAERAFHQALNIWDRTNYPLGRAYGSSNLGAVLTRRGNPEEALAYLENSETVFSELGAQSFMPSVNRRKAAAYLAMNDLIKAEFSASQALNQAKELSMRQEEGAALRILGVISGEKNDITQAIDILEKSIQIFHEAGIQYEEARSRLVLANVFFQDRQYIKIQSTLEVAIDSFRSIGAEVDLRQAEELRQRTTMQITNDRS